MLPESLCRRLRVGPSRRYFESIKCLHHEFHLQKFQGQPTGPAAAEMAPDSRGLFWPQLEQKNSHSSFSCYFEIYICEIEPEDHLKDLFLPPIRSFVRSDLVSDSDLEELGLILSKTPPGWATLNLYLLAFGQATASQAKPRRRPQKPKAKAAPKGAAKKTRKRKGG